ncbi:hypothetical protein JOQ06_022403, partial [Pogonophryne albipinna]
MKPDDNKPADSQELGPADQNPEEESPVYISTFTLQISESRDRQDHEDHQDQQYPAPEKPTPTTPEDHQNHQNPQDPSPEKPPPTTPEDPQNHQNHQDLQDLQNHQNHQDHQNPQDLQEHQDHHNPQDLQDLQNHQDHQNPQDLQEHQEHQNPQDLASLSNRAPPAPARLCGFLQKQGGPLRAWKQRWFRYEESTNQLFYYRTPQDVAPLGRVPLCRASFSYPLQGGGTFHIQTPERTFILKAGSQQLMLYWLQQLQGRRWQHRQTSCDPPSANHTTGLRVQASGLRVQASGFRPQASGFRPQGSGFRPQGSGLRVQASGLRVQASGLRVQASGLRVQASGFRPQGSGFRPQASGFRPQVHFLPVQSPGGGVEATWPPLTNMSLKHPLIHL